MKTNLTNWNLKKIYETNIILYVLLVSLLVKVLNEYSISSNFTVEPFYDLL